MRANRLTFGFVPADAAERHFRLGILHRENMRQGKRLGGFGQKEMLGHGITYRL